MSISLRSVAFGFTHKDRPRLAQDTDNPVAGPSASSTGSRSSSRAPKDDTKPSTPTVVPPSASLPSSRPPAAQNIPAQSADANKQLQSEDVEMNATASVLSPAMNDKVNRVLLTLTGSVPSDVAVAEAVDPTTVKSDVPMPSNIKHDLVPPPPDVDADAENTSRERDGSMDMDIDSSQDVPSVAHPADLGTVIQNLVKNINVEELVRNINVEDVVNDVNRHIASNTVDVSLELQEFSTADLPIPKPQEVSLEDAIPSSKTGLDAATVIIHHRGLASGAITMKFSVNQNQMDAITKWNNRLKHTEDLEDSLCLSLLCFAIPDLKTRLESSQSNDLRNLLPELECSWPKNGELNMDALWKGQRMTFPMAPPFALPPSGLTDVSPFLVVGENTLCIKQTRDMSEYWLLLCAHHPTTSQLNAVARRRHKERNWSAWLASISRPLQLPFSVPITAT
ncbi:hypothetical protein C8R45DRAFT_977543 [Mycena sanguinolenta]|nr:hypothetical protein C8R45DRAFT_977543 [Mycena sanguinolenta]